MFLYYFIERLTSTKEENMGLPKFNDIRIPPYKAPVPVSSVPQIVNGKICNQNFSIQNISSPKKKKSLWDFFLLSVLKSFFFSFFPSYR